MIARRTLVTFAPAAVLAAGLAGTGAYMWGRAPAPAAGIGGPFTLLDGAGRTVTDRDFRGKWMLVYFGYTHCPDACPTALGDMANAYDLLGAGRDKVAMMFITVDPERDTPAVMKDYVSNFDAPILGLSGSTTQVAAAEAGYRVYAAKHPEKDGSYSMDHSSIIYVMDPSGRFVANFTHETAPQQIADKMRALVG